MCCYVRISYNETEDMRLYLHRFQRGLGASEGEGGEWVGDDSCKGAFVDSGTGVFIE